MLPEYKPKIQRKPIDTEDSLCLWDHCVRGYSHQVAPRKQAKTKNKLGVKNRFRSLISNLLDSWNNLKPFVMF